MYHMYIHNYVFFATCRCGCIYELDLDSSFSATAMRGKLCGDPVNGLVPGMLSPNECNVESIAEPDNVAYDAEQDTMYIYEDSGLHENNFLWAYQVCNAYNALYDIL